MSGALAGRTIVVTRAAAQSPAFSDRLKAQGATVVELATIATKPIPEAIFSLDDALDEGGWRWVCATSPNGVEIVAKAQRYASASGRSIAVVGPGSASVLERFGLSAGFLPSRSLASVLGEELPLDQHDRVLLVQGDLARPTLYETLVARGAEVETITAYRTVSVAPSATAITAAQGADAIAFTSGSAVRSYLDAVGFEAAPPVVACIGPITAEAAVDAGLEGVVVASDHDLDGLTELLCNELGITHQPPTIAG